MKNLLAAKNLLAVLVVVFLVLAAVASTPQTDARWAATYDLGLEPVTLQASFPETTTSFDVRASIAGNRTVVPGQGTDPLDNVVPASVEYTASVLNLGPGDATDLTMTVAVPLAQNLDLVGVAPPSGVTCDASQAAAPQPGHQDHGLVVCSAPGPLVAGDSYAVVVSLVASQALSVPELVATIVVSSPASAGTDSTASWLLSSDAPSCPAGSYFDASTTSCVDPRAPTGGDGGVPPGPTNPMCTDGVMNYDVPPTEAVQSIARTYLNPLTGALSPTSGAGLVAGRWSQYVTPDAIFQDQDVSYQVTVAAPQPWVNRARTAPFSALQVSVPGGTIPSAAGNVWTGSPMTVTPSLLEHPFNVSISVDRANGLASDAYYMIPAVVVLMIDITDSSGSTRTERGYFVTKPLHQGSVTNYTCTTGVAVGGVTLWSWTASELEAIGWSVSIEILLESSSEPTSAAAAPSEQSGVVLEQGQVGKKSDVSAAEGLVDGPQTQEPPAGPTTGGGPVVAETLPGTS